MTTTSASLFSISDINELHALWRVVAEAKFHPDPEDSDLWSSPYVQTLALRIADAILESEKASGNVEAVERHLAWRRSLPSNVVLTAIRSKLRQDATQASWSRLSLLEKRDYLRARITPFTADDRFLDALIKEIEA